MLSLNNVSFKYTNDEYVFKNIDFKFPDRGFYFIIGKSGCGKSTLLSLIAGFLKGYEGEIIGNDDLSFVFQDPSLIDGLNVKENSLFSLTLNGEKDKKNVSLCEKNLNELGLMHLKDKKCDLLSGGEKQRVAFLRAKLANKDMILADEPTGALDINNSIVLMNLLKEESKNKLVICVTHNLTLANDYADCILELKNKKFTIVKDIKDTRNNVFKKEKEKEKRRYEIKFLDSLKIAFSFLYKKMGRVLLSSFTCGFAFCLLGFILSIGSSSNKFASIMTDMYLGRNVLKLSQLETVDQNNGISLERNVELNERVKGKLNKDFNIKFYKSLSFFVPSSYEYKVNEDMIDIIIDPIISYDKSKITVGRSIFEYNEVICNTNFSKAIFNNSEDILNHIIPIKIKKNVEIIYGNNTSYELIEYDLNLKIIGVVDEKNTFNYPTLYYDYNKMFDFIKKQELKGNSGYSIEELFNKDEYYGTDVNSYETIGVINEEISFYNWCKDNFKTLKVNSKFLSSYEACKTISTSISQIALILVVAIIIIVFFINIFSIFTLNIEIKKNYALVKAFSSNKKIFFNIIFANSNLWFLFSLFFFILFLPIFNLILPNILVLVGLPIELLNLNIIVFIIASFLMYLITLISNFASLIFLRKNNISMILRSEK